MTTKIFITDGAKTENILTLGASKKSIDPWDESRPGVWTGSEKKDNAPRLVPTVFASVSLRMQAMADLPFTIYSVKGDKELDSSDYYKNVVGFLPDPYRFLSMTEGAFVLTGQSYWYKGKGTKTGNVKELQYWRPDSVTLDTDAAKKGIIQFDRQGMTGVKYPAADVLYSWLPDPMVELGAPVVYPFASAMLAATANGAIAQWAADYMERGAVKAMMLMVDGAPPPGEVERMESWFNRFMRGTKNLMWKVFNSAGVKPTIIGDGLEALGDLTITEDLRKEITIAMGTQYIFDAQAYATSQKALERQFYQLTIVPDARIIQSCLNTQILNPIGYHLEFEPERLESFQEDEAEQAQSFGTLIDVLMKGLSFDVALKIAAEKLDYQFSDEQMAMIEADLKEDEKEPEPTPIPPPAPVEQVEEPQPNNAKAIVELDRWERKSLSAGKVVTWHTAVLSDEMVKAITDGVMTFDQARDSLRVKPSDSLLVLAAAIEKAAAVKGGEGSGNFDHAGRPGLVGGSAPSGGGGSIEKKLVTSPYDPAVDKAISSVSTEWKGYRKTIGWEAVIDVNRGRASGNFYYKGDELKGVSSFSDFEIVDDVMDKWEEVLPQGEYIEIRYLATLEKGYGEMILKDYAKMAAEKGKGIILFAASEAVSFYEKMGMKPLGGDWFYYSPGDVSAIKSKIDEPEDGVFAIRPVKKQNAG